MYYFLIYRTTNLINGKIYIGCHKTKNLNDGYKGSGELLLKAIKKYGEENFHTEILHICNSEKDMFNMEAKIVNEDFIANQNTYNIKKGGLGGFDFINAYGLQSEGFKNKKNREKAIVGRHKSMEQRMKDPVYKDWYLKKITFKGKTHTEETKKKIGEANSKHQFGKGNSQYGSMWVTDGKENKKIAKGEPIPIGFRRGRIVIEQPRGPRGRWATNK